MSVKELKVILIAVGIGFLFGVLPGVLFFWGKPDMAYGQELKKVMPHLNKNEIKAMSGDAEFNSLKVNAIEVKTIQLRNRFDFINGSGNLIASLEMKDGLPVFTFFDPRDKKPRLKFDLEDVSYPLLTSYPHIYLYDNNGKERTVLYVRNDNEGVIVIHGPDNSGDRFRVECVPMFGTKLYIGFGNDTWSLLQSHINTSELILRHKQNQRNLGIVIGGM